jgi:hypothetical protein
LKCDLPWSNTSMGGRPLSLADLPGDVTLTQGFRGAVGTPKFEGQILRVIQDEIDPAVAVASTARQEYENALKAIVKRLSWKDFELLVDLILDRSGWARVTRRGGPSEGTDLDVANWAVGERAFVQIKSAADQRVLDEYVTEFEKRPQYHRMIFAIHTSPAGGFKLPPNPDVHVWEVDDVVRLVVRVGLGEWVESKLA